MPASAKRAAAKVPARNVAKAASKLVAKPPARSRLCHALVVAPDDPPPFVSVAEVLRHARGVHVTVGEPPRAIEQLEIGRAHV